MTLKSGGSLSGKSYYLKVAEQGKSHPMFV
jgi:hypothetical protein